MYHIRGAFHDFSYGKILCSSFVPFLFNVFILCAEESDWVLSHGEESLRGLIFRL